jgi:hypothetical protein
MFLKLSPTSAARLYLIVGIIGVFLVVADVVLIILSPGMIAPYFTTVAGLCFIFTGFIARRAIRKTNGPK